MQNLNIDNININNNSPVIILIDVELEQDNSNTNTDNKNNNNTEVGELISQIINDPNDKLKFQNINMALHRIKQLKFNETIIIVNAEKFIDFVKLFNDNLINICIIPKIIIFSEEKKDIKLPEEIKNKKFYTHFGVKNKKEIKIFLEKEAKENKIIGSEEYPEAPPTTELALIFQKISGRDDLHLPLFYKYLLDISETNDKRFINTMNKHKNDEKYRILFNPIISCEDIPIELLSKYYARMYTVQGNFFEKMKKDLLTDYNKNNIIYQSYIKTLYEGIEKKALKILNNFKGLQLYSAQYFTDSQIEELNMFKKIRVQDYKMPLIFSKLFLSFTKDIKVAEQFFVSKKKYYAYNNRCK